MRMISIFLGVSIVLILTCCKQQDQEFDIVIYGGTSSGIAAAIQANRSGKSVVLLEPSNWIGGLTTGGLGQTDIGEKEAIGGISREFYQNIRSYYDDPANWNWQNQANYKSEGQSQTSEGEDAMWTFEPSAALSVFEKMIEEGIDVKYNQRIDLKNGVTMGRFILICN